MNRNVLWFLPAISVSIGIFLLSTILSVPAPVDIEITFLDKIEHAFAYFVLVMSFLIAFKKTDKLSGSLKHGLILTAAAYGITLEYVQYVFFENRVFEWLDAAANVLGAVLGLILFNLFRRG